MLPIKKNCGDFENDENYVMEMFKAHGFIGSTIYDERNDIPHNQEFTK